MARMPALRFPAAGATPGMRAELDKACAVVWMRLGLCARVGSPCERSDQVGLGNHAHSGARPRR